MAVSEILINIGEKNFPKYTLNSYQPQLSRQNYMAGKRRKVTAGCAFAETKISGSAGRGTARRFYSFKVNVKMGEVENGLPFGN